MIESNERNSSPTEKILILTPVKDGEPYLDTYFSNLETLTYPKELVSLNLLESDSQDGSFAVIEKRLPELREKYRSVGLWKKDFGYIIPPGRPRWQPEFQLVRRSILAKSRNHLLFRALTDEDWVLWLDVDVIEYPADIIERLLATKKSIVHPNCVRDYGGPSFDQNAWRGPEKQHLSDLRNEGELVRLDTVGGTMLLIKADIHRDGLIFPPIPYGRPNPRVREDTPEIETEGLGFMAADMGHQCWGMPLLEIKHASE
jgi:hypothetical protein